MKSESEHGSGKVAIPLVAAKEQCAPPILAYARPGLESDPAIIVCWAGRIICSVILLVLFVDLLVPSNCSPCAKPKVDETDSQIKGLRSQLETYRMHCGQYPPNLDALIDPNAAGNPPGWAGPYLSTATVPPDAWGHPLRYMRIFMAGVPTYSVTSAGPNGQFGDADDITNLRK